MEIATKYNPAEVEEKWYEYWLKNGYFKSKPDGREPYTIVIPPPNVTGVLHMGHMLNNTIQDILIRRARMTGKNACWVPGTDHASIATEAKVVNKLAAQGIKKTDLTREEFLKHAWEWTETHGGIILQQLRKLGASCDWDRTAFTMDELRSESVLKVFVDLYNKGLIYRGVRMVNWDPKALTALSDEEVVYKEEHGKLYYLRYKIEGEDGYAVVATTRPETIMGDTAMCINPNDPKNQHLKGKKVIVPLVNRVIPVIEDDYVDIEFGTGCLKVTPAHDVNDYMLGEKYNLPSIDIFNDNGTISDAAGMYVGMDRFDVRVQIEKDLEAAGLLEKTEAYTNKVGHSERTNVVIEPKLSMQWFLKMTDLAKPALEAVMNDDIKFYPAKYKNTYRYWMENVKDWCISRQLWWGHRIPAYTCDDCGEITVVRGGMPEKCPKCGSTHLIQDPDTLDTWFSSALWPFSTLGWPEKTPEFDYFYPTDVLVTGYDIIFFWVIRMVFSALEQTKQVPFHHVLIHGLVRDSQGRKMSKSLGNGIDPLEVIDKYGADALRLTLMTGNAPGNDMRFYWERVEASRNFANKVWNASRFIMMNLEKAEVPSKMPKDKLTLADKWILSKVNTLAKEVTDNLERFELGIAVAKLYDFIWDVFCDWYIEIAKIRLQSGEGADTAKAVLVYVLTDILKLLHPFMPFITEEIYQAIPHDTESIMISKWPEYDPTLSFADEEAQMEKIMDAIRAIRNRRAEMNIPPSKKSKVYVETVFADVFAVGSEFIKRLAYASDVEIADAFGDLGNTVTIVTNDAKIYIPLGDLVDFEAEAKRLQKELAAAEEKLAFINKKLDNPGFVNKAPEKVVQQNRDEAAKLTEKIANLRSSLENLGK